MDLRKYEEYIKKLVNDSGMFVTYTISEKDVPLSFSITHNNLNINLNMIFNILQNKPYPHLSEEQVLTIMVCHELGHIKELRIDENLVNKALKAKSSGNKDLWYEYILEREQKAWELGKQYIPKELLVEYDDFNKQSLDIYKSK